MEDLIFGIIVGGAFAFVVARILFNIMPRMESFPINIRLVIGGVILHLSDGALFIFFDSPTFWLTFGYSCSFIAFLLLIEWKQSGRTLF